MSNRFCSLFMVFCLVFTTLVQSGYGELLAAVNAQGSSIEMLNFFNEPTDESFPTKGNHEEEALQVFDILETEPQPNNAAHFVIHTDYNGNDMYFEFIESCITWYSDNTSPPPEA